MPALTFDDPRVIAYLEQLAAAGFLDKAVFSAIGEELLLSTDARFDSQTAPDGRPWEPLNSKYAEWKRAFHGHDRILKLRGYLRDTLRYQATDVSVAIGSNRVYSAIHQFGGQTGREHKPPIPARPYLGVSDDDVAAILEIIEDALAARQP
jgi:phage virion morphogenesis protein